jgi:hypothetical protein
MLPYAATTLRIYALLAVAVLFAGCERKADAPAVKTLTIAQLGKETDHLIFFSYVGSDGDFHYFTTAEGKQYQVARSEWKNPAAFPANGTMQLFMTVRDGKLTVPDPKEMSKLSEETF